MLSVSLSNLSPEADEPLSVPSGLPVGLPSTNVPQAQRVRRPRVLLIAELANPEWASVPREGWAHSQALGELVDAHLVTQVRNWAAIVRARLAADRFTTIDSSLIERPITRLAELLRGGTTTGWTTAMALSVIPYYYFEHLIWRRFGSDIRRGHFDLVHRLTPISPTMPSILAARCARAGVPFVIGPLNGGLPWPDGFGGIRRREREWLSYVREAYRFLPAYQATRRDAAAIIVGSRSTLEQLPAQFRHKAVYIPENAIDPSRFHRRAEGPVRLPLKVVFVGRLVPYKGADMLLEAAAPLIRRGSIELDVIGEGPELDRLRALADDEEVSRAVTFAGLVPHQLMQDRLAGAHVFGFPSVREFGGAVVVEAMAVGLVPIVVDYGGPGELVSERTGFVVPLRSRAEIVDGFRAILERLVADPSVIRPMGERARERALQHFTWSAKASQVREVYRWVLGLRSEKPDFGIPLRDWPTENSLA